MLAVKSVKQNYEPTTSVLELLELFRRMMNDCVYIGLQNNAWTLKRLSLLSYRQLARYECPSYYKLCAISRAAGILASRRKSLKRGHTPREPYSLRPQLVSCYGFKTQDGSLRIPVGRRAYENIRLNTYTVKVLSSPGVRVRSFLLTPSTVSITVSKEVVMNKCT